MKSVCVKRSACSRTASTTRGCEWPTLRQPTPPAKSMNVLPSTSVRVAPRPCGDHERQVDRRAARRRPAPSGRRISALRGPGISVLSSIVRVVATRQELIDWAVCAHGPLRPHDPPAARRGPHRHRPVRRGAAPALERRRARRPALPRLPQLALPVHRRQAGDGGADRARRGRLRRAVHPPSRASSCSARRSSASRCPTTSSPASRARARSAGSGSSSTRPPASSTPAGTATSRSSSRTSPTSRSRSTTG